MNRPAVSIYTDALARAATTHALLSSQHTDVTAAAVVRGDMIVGIGAAPNTKWGRVAAGAAGTYWAGGTDPGYATLNQAAVAGLTISDGPQFAHLHVADLAAIYTAAESWIGPSSTTGVYFKAGKYGFGTTNPGYFIDSRGSIMVDVSAVGHAYNYIRSKAGSEAGFVLQDSTTNKWAFYKSGSNTLDIYGYAASANALSFATNNNATFGATLKSVGAFGCNNATPQTAAAVGAAVTTTAATQTTPWGFATQAQADDIVTRVNSMRAALIANGIMAAA